MALATTDTATEAAITRFKEALTRLDWLNHNLAPTKERWSLRGALHKRWAICDQAGRRRHLKKATDAYKRASEVAGSESYQWLNALALQCVLRSEAARKKLRSLVDGYVDKSREAPRKVDRTFWDIVALPDALLHKHIVYGTLAPGVYGTLAPGAAVEELIEGYRQARAAGPSPRQWASVLDHIWFLAVMISDTKLACCNPAVAEALNNVLSSLSD